MFSRKRRIVLNIHQIISHIKKQWHNKAMFYMIQVIDDVISMTSKSHIQTVIYLNRGLQRSVFSETIKQYLDWGAGPRASQNLNLAAKTHAAIHGKYSPDIEDVKAVATGILRHRIIKNYKAEAEGHTEDSLIAQIL